jgi:hypothetical protein
VLPGTIGETAFQASNALGQTDRMLARPKGRSSSSHRPCLSHRTSSVDDKLYVLEKAMPGRPKRYHTALDDYVRPETFRCTGCLDVQPISAFGPTKTRRGHLKICHACFARYRRVRYHTVEGVRETQITFTQTWQAANRERSNSYRRAYSKKKRAMLTTP